MVHPILAIKSVHPNQFTSPSQLNDRFTRLFFWPITNYYYILSEVVFIIDDILTNLLRLVNSSSDTPFD